MLKLKRVYDPPSREDGERVLVDRLWPRGITQQKARLAGWLRELAPSAELRKWFGHDPARWAEFKRRYAAELEASPHQAELEDLAEKARNGTVTLVFAASDPERNNAVALKEFIERRDQRSAATSARPRGRGGSRSSLPFRVFAGAARA